MEEKYLIGHFGGFPLRLSWLPRLVNRYRPQGRVPSNLEAIATELGVGKNMAKSMRAWGRAARVLHDDGRISELASQLFEKFDPYLERGESVALLHWLIASNSQGFTAAAWLFNRFRTDSFTMAEAVSAFRDHLGSNGAKYAIGTLRGDVEPVLRMHAALQNAPDDEADDRFFSQLRFLASKRVDRMTVYSRTWEDRRGHVSERLLRYALLQSLSRRATASAALSSLYMAGSGQTAPGVVFGMSKEGFFDMVEHLDRDSYSGLSLSTMPGEDALLTATGDLADSCRRVDLATIDRQFFGPSAA